MITLSDPVQVRTVDPRYYVCVRVETDREALVVADWIRSTNLRGQWRRPSDWDELFRSTNYWEVVFFELTKTELTYLALCVKGREA